MLKNLFGPPDVESLNADKDIEGLIKALSYKKDWRIRMNAAQSLGNIGEKRSVDPLIRALEDEDSSVCAKAVEALGNICDPRGLAPLLNSLKDNDSSVKINAIKALPKLKDPQAIEPLASFLDYPDQSIVLIAASALVEFGDTRAVEPLIKLLDHRNYDYNKRAASALGKLGDPRAIAPLIEKLKGKSAGTQVTAEKALIEIGKSVVNPLIKMLEEGNKQDQRKAAIILKKMDWNPEESGNIDLAIKYYLKLSLWDPCIKIGAPAVEPLIEVLESGDMNARAGAARALGSIGDHRAVEPLLKALESKIDYLIADAGEALGIIGDSRAIDPLISLLRNKDQYVRLTAARALGKIGTQKAVAPLREALNDGNWDVRKAAATALKSLGVVVDKDWAEIDTQTLKVCARCGRTEEKIRNDLDEARRRGIVVIGNGDVLYYCGSCEKSFCGQCQIDLTIAVGCPICKNQLQPVSRITRVLSNK